MDEKSNNPLLPNIALIVSTAVTLKQQGHRVIIVSSGAIGMGLRRMHQDKRPKHLAKLQVRFSGVTALADFPKWKLIKATGQEQSDG